VVDTLMGFGDAGFFLLAGNIAMARGPRNEKVHSPMELYLREINETPLLDAEAEKELARRIKGGDSEARDQLVRANLRLVVNIARKYIANGVGLQDLIEEGNLGLLRAVEGFDASMNTRFSTYGSYWIKQSMRRAVVNTAKTIRIPAYMVELLTKWRRATAKLQEELDRPPTQEEVARSMNLSVKKLSMIRRALRSNNAIPQSDQDETGRSLDEQVIDTHNKASDAAMTRVEDLRQVRDLLARLDKREATVLRLRFGLDGEEPKTLKEVGERLSLTRERVRQIEGIALKNLGTSMDDVVERSHPSNDA
jgi:RNA polymerase primary sigma factor